MKLRVKTILEKFVLPTGKYIVALGIVRLLPTRI